jgi:hypothetical protein
MLQDHGVAAIQAARRQECERVARLANMSRTIKFYINDTVIENVTEFKYLGWIISADDYDDGAVNFNITKACSKMCVVPHVLNSQLGYS